MPCGGTGRGNRTAVLNKYQDGIPSLYQTDLEGKKMLENHASELLVLADRIETIGRLVAAENGDPESRGHALLNAAVEVREAVQGN